MERPPDSRSETQAIRETLTAIAARKISAKLPLLPNGQCFQTANSGGEEE